MGVQTAVSQTDTIHVALLLLQIGHRHASRLLLIWASRGRRRVPHRNCVLPATLWQTFALVPHGTYVTEILVTLESCEPRAAGDSHGRKM